MRILILQHHDAWKPGLIFDEARAAGATIQMVNMAEGDMPPRDLTGVSALVILGGPFHATQADEYPWMRQEIRLIDEAHEYKIPVLAIGFGAHLLSIAMGGGSKPLVHNDQLWLEAGWANLRFDQDVIGDGLFKSFPPSIEGFTFHSDELQPPPGSKHLGMTSICPVQGFLFKGRFLGLQPHLEIRQEGIEAIIADQAELIARAGISPVHLMMDMLRRLQHVELYASMLFSRFFDFAADEQ